eukprot:77260_1
MGICCCRNNHTEDKENDPLITKHSSLNIIQSVSAVNEVIDDTIYIASRSNLWLYSAENSNNVTEVTSEHICENFCILPTLQCITQYQFRDIPDFPNKQKQLQYRTKLKRVDNNIYYCKAKNTLDIAEQQFYPIASEYCLCVFFKVQTLDSSSIGYIYEPTSFQAEHPSRCVSISLKLFTIFTSYSMIFTLISDLLLICNVYYHQDYAFFCLSIVFLSVPLLIVSVQICIANMMVTTNKENGPQLPSLANGKGKYLYSCLLCVPVLNIPFAMVFDFDTTRNATKIMIGVLLSAIMTYPLYIINLSFMLEQSNSYSDISVFNILQFGFSLFTLSVSPFFNLLTLGELIYMNYGLILSIKDKIKLYGVIAITLIPTFLLEIIHFFPILFAYYIDQKINLHEFFMLMLLFNVPKIVFVIHMMKNVLCIEPMAWLFSEDGINVYGKCMIYCVFPCSMILCSLPLMIGVLMTLPLIPYILMMLFKDADNRDVLRELKQARRKNIFFRGLCSFVSLYYWNVVIYLWISYGWSSLYLLLRVGINIISYPVKISILVVLVLLFVITVTLPKMFYYFRIHFCIN